MISDIPNIRTIPCNPKTVFCDFNDKKDQKSRLPAVCSERREVFDMIFELDMKCFQPGFILSFWRNYVINRSRQADFENNEKLYTSTNTSNTVSRQ